MKPPALVTVIGQIQITHAWLEDDLRIVWLKMREVEQPEPATEFPKHFVRLIEYCQSRSESLDIPVAARSAIHGALHSAKEAHEARNHLVHDVWLPDLETGEYRSGKEIRRTALRDGVAVRSITDRIPTTPLAEFEVCLRELRALRWRMNAVDELLSHRDTPLALDDFHEALTIARGGFRLGRDGNSITWPR